MATSARGGYCGVAGGQLAADHLYRQLGTAYHIASAASFCVFKCFTAGDEGPKRLILSWMTFKTRSPKPAVVLPEYLDAYCALTFPIAKDVIALIFPSHRHSPCGAVHVNRSGAKALLRKGKSYPDAPVWDEPFHQVG